MSFLARFGDGFLEGNKVLFLLTESIAFLTLLVRLRPERILRPLERGVS